MADEDQKTPMRLGLITYLAPSIPVEYFEILKEYLEEVLECYVYLIVESRWSGPPADRVDPFTLGDADIGFMCSPTFLRVHSQTNTRAALLGVAPAYINPRNQNNLPVYFTEVVVNQENCDRFKKFEDLRGSRWAFNDSCSLSGCLTTKKELRRLGEDLSFFGTNIESGSHLTSIQMILNKTVDAAAIDSNVLALQMKAHPELRQKLHTVTSWGPLPVYPGVVRSNLPDDLKQSIARHLLSMHQDPKWQARLNDYMVSKFVPVTMENYQEVVTPKDEF